MSLTEWTICAFIPVTTSAKRHIHLKYCHCSILVTAQRLYCLISDEFLEEFHSKIYKKKKPLKYTQDQLHSYK